MNKQFTHWIFKKDFINPQVLMTLELITIELLATYALTYK
jgi:hypothetical protein